MRSRGKGKGKSRGRMSEQLEGFSGIQSIGKNDPQVGRNQREGRTSPLSALFSLSPLFPFPSLLFPFLEEGYVGRQPVDTL